MNDSRATPLGALGRGVAAGVIGTVIFTGYQTAKSKLASSGSEESGPPARWKDVPAPAQVGKRLAEGVFHRRVTLRQVPVLTQIMHWGYGVGWGAVYGLVHETFRPHPLVHGAGLGVLVTAADYTLLPAMKLYDPPWEYDPKTLAADLGNHLVYGFAVAGAYRALDRL